MFSVTFHFSISSLPLSLTLWRVFRPVGLQYNPMPSVVYSSSLKEKLILCPIFVEDSLGFRRSRAYTLFSILHDKLWPNGYNIYSNVNVLNWSHPWYQTVCCSCNGIYIYTVLKIWKCALSIYCSRQLLTADQLNIPEIKWCLYFSSERWFFWWNKSVAILYRYYFYTQKK